MRKREKIKSTKGSENKPKEMVRSTGGKNRTVQKTENSPGTMVGSIKQLQRTIGNRAVQRMIKSGYIQLKENRDQPANIHGREVSQLVRKVENYFYETNREKPNAATQQREPEMGTQAGQLRQTGYPYQRYALTHAPPYYNMPKRHRKMKHDMNGRGGLNGLEVNYRTGTEEKEGSPKVLSIGRGSPAIDLLNRKENSAEQCSSLFNSEIGRFRSERASDGNKRQGNRSRVAQADCGCSGPSNTPCNASATGVSLGASSAYNDGTRYGLVTPIIIHGKNLADVLDSELVGTSIEHKGCFATRPSSTGSTSGFMAADSVPPDQHLSGIADHLSYYDKKSEDGSYCNLQMDIFKIPKCGINTPQSMPNSGYRIKREVKKEGKKVVGIFTKTAEAVKIGSHSSTKGLTAKKEAKITLRTT